MARAMARGWGEPVLCTDSGSGSAQALVDELGGERVSGNRELAERADVVVLCHKPYQLDQVAEDSIRPGEWHPYAVRNGMLRHFDKDGKRVSRH